MGKLNIPDTRKIFGANIVPKKADITGAQAWGNMILSWDWDGWIKPQIDLIAGNNVGANCIRMIGEVYGIATGMYTEAFYLARHRQLADYCASLGLHLYACCSGKGSPAQVTISNDGAVNLMMGYLQMMQQYPKVIGVDVVQESSIVAKPIDANLIDILARLRANGVTLPMTCSTHEINVASAATAPWIYSMGQYFDFIDVHSYTYPVTMQSLDGLRAAFPDKDIILGEWGRAQSITEDTRLADQKQVLDLMNSGDRRIRGGLRWAITDQDDVTTNMWGGYDVSFAPRLRELNMMRRYTGGSVARLNRLKA
jgi:hypothetical protein